MEVLSSHWPSRKLKERDVAGSPEPPVAGGNRLLAGYLAHEFLSSGTVLGERHGPVTGAEASRAAPADYEALAVLVQRGRARVPGVVNPAQLAAWRLGEARRPWWV